MVFFLRLLPTRHGGVISCDEEPVESDFKIENVSVKYSDPDFLSVVFSFSGGDGYSSLRFEFYCLDDAKQ